MFLSHQSGKLQAVSPSEAGRYCDLHGDAEVCSEFPSTHAVHKVSEVNHLVPHGGLVPVHVVVLKGVERTGTHPSGPSCFLHLLKDKECKEGETYSVVVDHQQQLHIVSFMENRSLHLEHSKGGRKNRTKVKDLPWRRFKVTA